MNSARSFLRAAPILAASALALTLAACDKQVETPPAPAASIDATPTPAAPTSQATAGVESDDHHGDEARTLEEARAEGHREGMEMEREAHERGMQMGAKMHEDGMRAGGSGSAPMPKSDPMKKMDGHM